MVMIMGTVLRLFLSRRHVSLLSAALPCILNASVRSMAKRKNHKTEAPKPRYQAKRAGTSCTPIRTSSRRSPRRSAISRRRQGSPRAVRDIQVPTEEVTEVVRGSKKVRQHRHFPGYVLVKMEMTDEAYHLVKNTPKVTAFSARRTTPIGER
jgi:transcriptional antiterminator NusG